jgi:multicomponent K+:H+ antiporter subunit E
MKRWRLLVFVTAALVVVWLLLQQSVGVGAVLVGAVLSVLAIAATRKLDLPDVSFRRPWSAVTLAVVVLGDIIRSNVAVARIILGLSSRGGASSGFLRIPLDMRAPYGLATLACIITSTPGTIWVAYDSTSHSVLLHILDLVDEKVWLETIKGKYERRLMEIFE